MVLALFKRASNGAPLSTTQHDTNFDHLEEEVNGKAPLNSPAFTGSPTASTPSQGTNSTRLATTAYVDEGLGGKAASSHTHTQAQVTGLASDLALKAPLTSPVFGGNPTGPTPSFGDDDTSLATTAFVQDAVTQTAPNDKAADFTFALADASSSKITRSTSASSVTGTVPPNSSVAFPVNQTINLVRYGAGAFVIAPGAGVTIQKASDRLLTIRAQYTGATLWKVGTDTWLLIGELGS
jgi:hypothetical protein